MNAPRTLRNLVTRILPARTAQPVTSQPVHVGHQRYDAAADIPPTIDPAYGDDCGCVGCGAHISEPCDPGCPRQAWDAAAEDGAEVMTAADILADYDSRGDRSPWSIIAGHLSNGWIRPGSYLACVAGFSGVLAPFSHGEHYTAAAAAAQVRPNLRYYADGWVVTNLGAWQITRD